MSVSVGDPRGAFSFCVRRLTTGEIVIHTPHPDESLAHMKTKQHSPGTLEIVYESGDPIIFQNEPRYWIVFIDETTASWEPRKYVDIYDDPTEVYEDSGNWRSPKDPVIAYIPLGEVSYAQAEKDLAKLETIVDQWISGEIELDDIPGIEY
jgi:hypothetical protein